MHGWIQDFTGAKDGGRLNEDGDTHQTQPTLLRARLVYMHCTCQIKSSQHNTSQLYQHQSSF